MNYRERHEAEREKMRKRTRRNTRISMLVCVLAAGAQKYMFLFIIE